jgi:[acyl-carrier-protein] S-malonyltransferase
MGMFYELREYGVEPVAVAGHSLGEYGAACAAGCIGLEEGARLVAERDRLMSVASRQHPGGMVAVIGADPREVVEAVQESGGVVVAANFNTPRQTVISGEQSALDSVCEKVGGRKSRLDVMGAFHSPLMQEAAVGMERLLNETEVSDPRIPLIGGTDGGVMETAEDVRLALGEQMLSPVRWVAVVERMQGLGVEEMLEAGEVGTLVRMLRDFEAISFAGRKAGEVLS